MNGKNISIATAYYKAVGDKNIEDVARCIHPDIVFKSPFANVAGKSDFLSSVEKFQKIFDKLTIAQVFESQDQALVIYDLECPAPIGALRTAAHMHIKDDLIHKLELIFDTRPFMQK